MDTTETNVTSTAATGPVAAVIGQFQTPGELLKAAGEIRQRGFRHWDAHSPFPIHGLEQAMGIRMTILPWLVLGAGLTGVVVAMVMQYWTNAVHYPLIISGKPLFSVPANIPVAFELIVLFSALTAFLGALALSQLPQYWHATVSSRSFSRVTNDGFFISLEAKDPLFNEASAGELLESLGATNVEACFDPVYGAKAPKVLNWALATVALLAFLPPLGVAWVRATTSSTPRIQILQDMDFQPKYKAQTTSTLFLDDRSNRPQLSGTVARGQLNADQHLARGKMGEQWATTFPESIPLNMETMSRGEERYNVYCSQCHGLSGAGDGMTAQRAQQRADPDWVPPVQLYSQAVIDQPPGQIYNTITNGIRKMPAYNKQIPIEDRWAIVLYVQALQRSQAATVEDIPEDMRDKVQ
jgi:mono/diheme cytochrome c family protein